MAFPFVFAENFESGTKGNFDTETDTDSILDYPHYSELARTPGMGLPFSGAYCLRIAPAGGTAVATLTEADINIADTVTNYFAFNVFFSSDFDATANDTFALLELQGVAAAVTVSIGARYVAATDVINIGAGAAASAAAPTSFATLVMARDTWYTIEAKVTIQTGGTGTVDVYITKEGDAAQTTADIAITGVTNIAVTDGVFGLQDHLATTTGTILLDGFVQDDERIGVPRPRWPLDVLLTQSGHAFVGPGVIDNVTLISGAGTDNVLQLYDTDTADILQPVRTYLANTANGEIVDPAGMPVGALTRGAYVALSGTNPRALVKIKSAVAFGSDGAVRNYAVGGRV